LDHELGDGLTAIGYGFPMLVRVHDFGDVMGLVAEEVEMWVDLLSRQREGGGGDVEVPF
jgi:hypothetical protein